MSSRQDKEPLLKQSPGERESVESKNQFLMKIIPFDSLSEPELGKIATTMEWKALSPGETIIKQGTPGERFYLIKSGLVKVFLLDEENKETVLGFLGEGDCFGEISLLTQGPTTTNVQTVEQTLALVQEKGSFLQMTQKHAVFYKFFNQLLTQRMRSVYKELLSETPGVS